MRERGFRGCTDQYLKLCGTRENEEEDGRLEVRYDWNPGEGKEAIVKKFVAVPRDVFPQRIMFLSG